MVLLSTISFRTSEKEKQLIQDYARLNGLSTSEYVRNATLEKIEDEHDSTIAEERFNQYKNNGEKSTAIEVAQKLFDSTL